LKASSYKCPKLDILFLTLILCLLIIIANIDPVWAYSIVRPWGPKGVNGLSIEGHKLLWKAIRVIGPGH
jgi:hypothetical protein